ncbi:similar to Saccharomyces cerevisiae YGL167C PMR1 High affinity Ca2+/Mn2+ P-type ATPase required for Ca2+ and Mn2+ transport into Golgi [Maudiozyma saulgeensis]|uniref:Calcium-transporting ATPase n=1 Tax=Maudiozyma saulgeensis TaxID=1789683 RepID=A0A1X7R1G9_9SACH|nr:similar to Saccharomyces cerevisiae YGL167C PMR1 High affinity Ca2+/Mn2+ P-type ATPase required for Ca2+ and Mn2+ transport into Golgi [Kazachstania saulgeensis]
MSANPFEGYLNDNEKQVDDNLNSDESLLLSTKELLSKATPSLEFCKISVEETVDRLNTNSKTGLASTEEANHRRKEYGPNEISVEDDESLWKKFLSNFVEDRLILLLIGSAFVSAIMGNLDDAISITLAIIIVVSVGFVQEYRSEKSLEALNKLVPAECHLVRGGQEAHVLAAVLVPGDLVCFRIGDRIPADLRITEAFDLSIDESNLTGENEPVHKVTSAINKETFNYDTSGIIPLSDRTNIAYMGTLVKEGHGKGIVVGTSTNTSFGAVFEMMSSIEKPKTPLQLAMDKLGKDLSLFSFIVIGFICLIGIIQGRSWLEMFQISVSLAVAAIPEGLPIIVTVTLALGVLRMAKRKAIVRRLPSVETLGSVNVICSDKTGTLTSNHMTVCKIWCLGSMTNKLNVLDLQKTKGTNFKNYLTDDVRATLNVSNICNNASFSVEHSKYLGNPTDVALLEQLSKFELEDNRPNVKKIHEIPFNSKRKFMATEVFEQDGSHVLYVKGAFEKILSYSNTFLNEKGKIEKLTDAQKVSITECAESLASEGLRTLAFAKLQMKGTEPVTKLTEDMVTDLTFTGLIGMSDPPRPTVKPAIEQLIRGGVHIIMITGDSESTAVNIARQIGIPVIDPKLSVLNGDKLNEMSDDQLANVIDHVSVFARATPEHKLNIVRALRQRGEVVAMTGDGVNDAPALKLADIGVSMGKMGTDVAKEASDMVLTDDDFSTILTAIEEGKGIFNNIQNFLTFQLSTSIAALSLVALSTLFKLPNPLNAMQILWINILMDGPPAQSLGVEPVDHEVMKKPPRRRTDKILTKQVLRRLVGTAVCIIVGTIYVFVKEMAEDGKITPRDTTMTFTCFVFFDMFNALACRHSTKSIFEVGFLTNKMFNAAVGLSLLGQMCAIYIPFFQNVFKTERLSLGDLFFLLIVSSSVFIIDEIRKYWDKKKAQNDPSYYSMV